MRSSDSPLALRIAHCLPGATFELEALVGLIGIEETDTVDTAAVTCRGRARLLINPDFVASHCQRDEHLFLLVMHELWHVLLGHTTLYPRIDDAHNIAFDALINAGLSRQHPEPAYRGLFERINPPDRFPGVLLRPPVGWPHAPVYDVPGPKYTDQYLRRLYPPPGTETCDPTYEELIALISRAGPTSGDDLRPVLLGDHTSNGVGGADNGSPLNDTLFGPIMRRVVGRWPAPPMRTKPRNGYEEPIPEWVSAEPAAVELRAVFSRLIRRVLTPSPHGSRQRARNLERTLGGLGPLPNTADRLLPAKRALGSPATLSAQWVTAPVRARQPPARTLVYLDVSGSMTSMLPRLLDLLLSPVRQRLIDVLQFSTTVVPLSLDDLTRGELTTTHGTDIDCVLDHILTRPERQVLIVTDGYVGTPTAAHVEALRRLGTRIYAAIPTHGDADDLAGIADITLLPALD